MGLVAPNTCNCFNVEIRQRVKWYLRLNQEKMSQQLAWRYILALVVDGTTRETTIQFMFDLPIDVDLN